MNCWRRNLGWRRWRERTLPGAGSAFVHVAASPCEQGEYQGGEFSDLRAPFDLCLSRSAFYDSAQDRRVEKQGGTGGFFVRVRSSSPDGRRQRFHRKDAKAQRWRRPRQRPERHRRYFVARLRADFIEAMRAALGDRRAIFAPLRLRGKSCSVEAHAAAESAPAPVRTLQFQRARSNEARSLGAQSGVVKVDVWATPGIATQGFANDRRRNRQRSGDMQKIGRSYACAPTLRGGAARGRRSWSRPTDAFGRRRGRGRLDRWGVV